MWPRKSLDAQPFRFFRPAYRGLTEPANLFLRATGYLDAYYQAVRLRYRDLLPVRDSRYDDYGLRDKVREDIRQRKDVQDAFSTTASRYWSAFDDLCRAIDEGDPSIGLPPYNGGLFDRRLTPLLSALRLGDAVMADTIDALSFERAPEGRRYINYRDLGVQQLGSIYERLLEQVIVRDGGLLVVRLNAFARRNTGSYYTPDDLVGLIVRETVDPLVKQRLDVFVAEAGNLAESPSPENDKIERLKRFDPAESIVKLKICDPAMGSGHFLVNLVDHLADRVIAAMAEAESVWNGYRSPLMEQIETIRNTIIANAEKQGWGVDFAQLDDRHIVRRIVLKRCVYGVDKNAMAVELAKVSLWLHTFTVGAPLSFLDHHLRCGDSLFGAWVNSCLEKVAEQGGALLSHESLGHAARAAAPMQIIEELSDAELEEAHRSADVFNEVSELTAPVDALLSLSLAFEWMDLRDRAEIGAVRMWLDGQFGDPVAIAVGTAEIRGKPKDAELFARLLDIARTLIADQRYLNWQVAFPGVWSKWEDTGLHGGFDAIIGNPPWDRVKLQQVEWFAARRPEIARAPRAADRKRMIERLETAGDLLAKEYAVASRQALNAARVARACDDYPFLSRGDVNLYSLFVERSMQLVKPDGMIGLLVPSGIAADKTAAKFFKQVATQGRLRVLYDFENRRTRYDAPPFFPDIDSRQKFCAFVASRASLPAAARCAFFLQDVSELDDPERCFPLSAEDFARVNPNTGTAPICRTRRDAELTTAIYERLPVLVDRSSGEEAKAWPVKYSTMFHMTNDSHQFRTRMELGEQEGAWPIGGNRFDSPSGEWAPLYEGKMVQAFDHRAASVVINPENLHRPAQPKPATTEQHQDAEWLPDPQYWVLAENASLPEERWLLTFKDVTAPTNVRSMIAAFIPNSGVGNTLPILSWDEADAEGAALLCGNLNSMVFDYVARQKIQGQHLNLFIIEQIPVVPRDSYQAVKFGRKSAAEIVRDCVLELTYTARDMAPFATDLGYVDEAGKVLEPFLWDEERRLLLRAKLDAVYFRLYGITNRDDIRYIYSTFPIVEREEMAAWGSYRSRELCLAWMNALSAGDTEADIAL